MKISVFVAACAMSAVAGMASADFTEGFESGAPGWGVTNNSSPVGTQSWFIRGSGGGLPDPHSGSSYAGANYQNTTESGVGTISTWLFSPVDTIKNGDKFSFWTTTLESSQYPDRLQVRLSTNGASSNVGASPTSVGDFSTLLLDINPTYSVGGYPEAYTQYTITISGLAGPVSGRFAFRYFVENGGGFGDNSNFIAVDDVAFTSIPAPASMGVLALAGLVAGRRRR